MPTPEEILSSLGLDTLIADRPFTRDTAAGTLANPAGARVVGAGPELMHSLQLVLERERSGAWSAAMKATGQACGKKIGANIDEELAALGKPALASLPLEACLAFVERYFAEHGWGRLTPDLRNAAEHGVVVVHLDGGFLPSLLHDTGHFVDSLVAGMLQGFCEHLSGQELGCEELACARRGATRCTFAVTAPERLAAIMPLLGQESADAIVARLCS